MINEFVKAWEANKDILRNRLENIDVGNVDYSDLVKLVIDVVINPNSDDFNKYDSSKITVIDNGDYQGTQLFIIPLDTYQPCEDDYIVTAQSYGSCSGCDVLRGLKFSNNKDNDLNDLMTLCLHLLQRFRYLYPRNGDKPSDK